jgi:hypothetical protein
MSQAGVVTMKAMVQRLNRRLERDSDCRQISFSLAFAFRSLANSHSGARARRP